MPPARPAPQNLFGSPPIEDAYDPTIENKWMAWNHYYYVYDDELYDWATEMIKFLESFHFADVPKDVAGPLVEIQGEDVWKTLGGFSALVDVFRKTKKKVFRPFIQRYLDAWENFSIFNEMRKQIEDGVKRTFQVKHRESDEIVWFLLLGGRLLRYAEPSYDDWVFLQEYQGVFVMEKYPEWLKLRPEMPGFWEVIIRGNVEERHPLYPAPDHAGQSLAPRNGWESYDWMHYTPREKVLFGVEDTGVMVSRRAIGPILLSAVSAGPKRRTQWIFRSAKMRTARLIRVARLQRFRRRPNKFQTLATMQPPRAFIYNAQKLRRIGAEPPTPDQLASLGFAQPEAGPPKELVAVDSTTHSGARALTANEQTLLDIITHPLYLASQEENALLSEQLKQAQNSEAHERSLAVESRKECTAKTKELEYLKAELLVKTKEYNQHKERQARALEEKISELGWAQKATSDAIAEAEITKNECAAKVKAAESKEKATKQKNEALELELGMRTESLLQTEGQIERYENQIAELKAKFEESESDRATLQVEITRVRAFRTDKEVEAHQRAVRDQLAAERKLEADQLRAEIKELKEKNEEAERARKADTTLLQNYAAENHDLKERIAELKG